MNLITKKKLSEFCRISAQAIDKFQKKVPPVIDFVDYGKTASGKTRWRVEQFGELTVAFIKEQQGKNPEKQIPEVYPRTKEYNCPPKPSNQPKNTEQEPITGKQHATSKKYDSIALAKVKYLKAEEDLEKVRIFNQQARGDLIDKELVKKLFGKMYEIDQNQFKTINVSITPKISAAYNSANTNKTNDIIELIKSETELSPEKSKNFKTEINKILESGEPDRILEMNKILENTTGKILENIQREVEEFIKMVENKGD